MDSKDLPYKLKEYFLNTRMFFKFGESNLSTATAEQVENFPLFFCTKNICNFSGETSNSGA